MKLSPFTTSLTLVAILFAFSSRAETVTVVGLDGLPGAGLPVGMVGRAVWHRHKRSFLNNLVSLTLLAGLNDVRLSSNETMSGPGGFSFDYATAGATVTPLPGTLLLFAMGLGALGLLGWRREAESASSLI